MGRAQLQGTVKRVVRDKGFGFILCATDGQEYFFHHSNLMDTTVQEIQEGDAVTFLPGKGKPGKGPRAENIALV